MSDNILKKCIGECGLELPLTTEYFYFRKSGSISSYKCKICSSKTHHIHYQNKKEEINNKNKVRYQKNKEKILEQMKEYYNDNREKKLTYQKEYNINHKEEIKIYKKQYSLENNQMIVEKNKEYRNRPEIKKKKHVYDIK